MIRDLRYHSAEPGDVIIQPPCFANCLLTVRSFNTDGLFPIAGGVLMLTIKRELIVFLDSLAVALVKV